MEIAAIIFVLVMLGFAYVVFRILKRVIRFFLRLIVAMVIIAVALIGGLALWSAEVDASASSVQRSTR